MAIQRYISTSFWDDGWVQSIDPSEKLMYLYLMTNPLTNIAGIYKITDKRIHHDTGFNIDMVHKLLGRFEKARKAYRSEEYIIIPSWPKHQKWREKKTIETGIRKILAELPISIRDKAIKVGYLYPIDTVPIAYPYSPSYSDSDSDSDSDMNSDMDMNSDTPAIMTNHDAIMTPKENPPATPPFPPDVRPKMPWDDDPTPEPPKAKPVTTAPGAGSQRIEVARQVWNETDGLPKYRYLAVSIPPDKSGPILRMMGAYADDDIYKAIANYADILSRSDLEAFPRYTGFPGFMAGGVEAYCDDAKPYERCKKRTVPDRYAKPGALDDRPDALTSADIERMQRETESEEYGEINAEGMFKITTDIPGKKRIV